MHVDERERKNHATILFPIVFQPVKILGTGVYVECFLSLWSQDLNPGSGSSSITQPVYTNFESPLLLVHMAGLG